MNGVKQATCWGGPPSCKELLASLLPQLLLACVVRAVRPAPPKMKMSYGGVPFVGKTFSGVFTPGEATGVLLSPWAALGFTLGIGKEPLRIGIWLEECLELCTWGPQQVSPNRLAIAWASLLALLHLSPWLPGRCLLIFALALE